MKFFENFKADQSAVVASGHTFQIPAFPDTTGSSHEVETVTGAVWSHTEEYVHAAKAVEADKRYSDFGRAEKLEPLAESAYKGLLGGWRHLRNFELSIDSREHALVGIPEIDRSNILAHLEEREIRDWWSRQDVASRAELMRGFEEAGQESMRVALAILRSPLPQVEMEKMFFRRAWDEAARASNPVEAERIELGRKCIEWSAQNLQQAAVVVKSISGWESDRLIRHAITAEKGEFLPFVTNLGVSKQEVARVQLQISNQR